MANSQLTTGSNSGIQTTTQSPQSAGGAATGGTPSNDVQTGTANTLLTTDNGGLPLHNTSVTALSLTDSSSTGSVQTAVPTIQRHINAPLFGISGLLFLVAAVLFWTTGRSSQASKPSQPSKSDKPVKSTTKKKR